MDPKTTKAAHTITQAAAAAAVAAARTASPPQHPQDDAVRHRRQRHIPLSLGKASLRLRLEAYYSLIAPATVSDRTVWLPIYDQIYDKVRSTLPCTCDMLFQRGSCHCSVKIKDLYTMQIVDWICYFWHVLITENWIELFTFDLSTDSTRLLDSRYFHVLTCCCCCCCCCCIAPHSVVVPRLDHVRFY